MRYSRLKRAKVPVQNMIEKVREYQEALKHNPAGFDQMSWDGYEGVLQNLQNYQNSIDSGEQSPNPVWGILDFYAPKFTSLQYEILENLAHQVVDN